MQVHPPRVGHAAEADEVHLQLERHGGGGGAGAAVRQAVCAGEVTGSCHVPRATCRAQVEIQEDDLRGHAPDSEFTGVAEAALATRWLEQPLVNTNRSEVTISREHSHWSQASQASTLGSLAAGVCAGVPGLAPQGRAAGLGGPGGQPGLRAARGGGGLPPRQGQTQVSHTPHSASPELLNFDTLHTQSPSENGTLH